METRRRKGNGFVFSPERRQSDFFFSLGDHRAHPDEYSDFFPPDFDGYGGEPKVRLPMGGDSLPDYPRGMVI